MSSLKAFKIKTSVRDHVSCNSCTHLSKEKLNGKYCQDLGIIEVSETCGSYTPNVHELRLANPKGEVVDLFKAIRALPESFLPIVASLLARESRTRKFTAFKILQPVMVLIEGTGDHVNDYCKAYVLDADKDYIRLINKSGSLIAQFPINSSSVLTLRQYNRKKESMSKDKRQQRQRVKLANHLVLDDVVPTIDDNPDSKVEVKKLRKDLVSLFEAANYR